jgi:hypothetical protein
LGLTDTDSLRQAPAAAVLVLLGYGCGWHTLLLLLQMLLCPQL